MRPSEDILAGQRLGGITSFDRNSTPFLVEVVIAAVFDHGLSQKTHYCHGAGGCRAPGNVEVMSMDRLNRVLTGGTLVVVLGILVAAPGCHSAEKVPPGKQYPTMVGSPNSLSFNSDPHPNNSVGGIPFGNGNASGMPGMQGTGGPIMPPSMDSSPAGIGANQPQYGTPSPNTSSFGAPAVGGYNGTVGTATPSPYGPAVK
jgi:hypothetical protein